MVDQVLVLVAAVLLAKLTPGMRYPPHAVDRRLLHGVIFMWIRIVDW
jgi:hypothetical protein